MNVLEWLGLSALITIYVMGAIYCITLANISESTWPVWLYRPATVIIGLTWPISLPILLLLIFLSGFGLWLIGKD